MNCQLSKFRAGSWWFAVALVACLHSAIQAQSLVPNHDFEIDVEADSNPDDWFSGNAVSYITNDDSDGAGTASVAEGTGGGDWRSSAFAVTPGEELTFSFDYKVAGGSTGEFRADLRFFTGMDAGGGTAGSFQGEANFSYDVATVTQDAWLTAGPFVVNVPLGSAPPLLQPNFADVRISSAFFGPALDGELRLDRIIVTRVPEPSALALTSLATCCVGGIRRRSKK